MKAITGKPNKVKKIYSYILRVDDGAAPNPFWETCTLAICKPAIRRNADVGDWIVGTGSKSAKCNDDFIYDLSDHIVYAMKVDEVLTLKEYDDYCNTSLPNKIPNWNSKQKESWIGDCIYDYSKGKKPKLRKSVHTNANRKTDLSGENCLLSCHYYYFGEDSKKIPKNLKLIIKKNQGHKKIINPVLIDRFERWIGKFQKNKLYADPQMLWLFKNKNLKTIVSKCAKQNLKDDINQTEKIIS